MSSQQTSALQNVLQKLLAKIGDGRMLVLSTADGMELLTVSRDSFVAEGFANFDKASLDCLVTSYTMSTTQASKLGLGGCEYSIAWTDHGTLLHTKAGALIITMVMEEDANLGLVEEHLASLRKILKPFSSENFLKVTL